MTISKLPSNVIPVSRTDNQLELAKYYSLADITILTSKKRDVFNDLCRITFVWDSYSRF